MKRLIALLFVVLTLSLACSKTIVGPIHHDQSPALYVSLDSANALTTKLPYQLGGCVTQFLAAVKLQAKDSLVQIDTLKVFCSASTPANIFCNLLLVDDQGNVLAANPNVQSTTIFTNVGKIGDQARTIYLKADLNKIGKDEVGQINATASFRFGGIAASYAGSKKAISNIRYENDSSLEQTNPSQTITVVAAKIAAVDLVNSNETAAVAAKISGTGWCNVAIIKVATSASSNTIANGDPARIILDKIRVNIQKNSGMTISEAQIGRVRPSDIYFLSATYSATTEFDMTQPSIGSDEEIDPVSSVYYLVRVNISALAPGGQNWIEVDLNDLEGDATSANFVWRDGSDAAQKFPLKLTLNQLTGNKITE
ncbi:MAG: hypothetical protein PHE24_02090 [Patescibacteria group bacterium]|nr:hypothetical protein [Patescibacteria group bacterium]